MDSKLLAKSILKQPSVQTTGSVSDEQKAKVERDRRNLGVALFHARKLQTEKDIQATILANIETLLDYSSESLLNPVEAEKCTSLLTPFQPSDFESLVEERRIDGKCGYLLCSNGPRAVTIGANAAWKLRGKGAADFCSNECLRKALYVKMQLSEVPAWERSQGQDPQIMLPGEDSLHDTAASSDGNRVSQRWMNDRELALERGESAGGFRPNQVMTDTIIEKKTASTKPRVISGPLGSSHDSIEGYIPSTTFHRGRRTSLKSGNTINPSTKMIDGTQNDEDEAWKALFENMDMP